MSNQSSPSSLARHAHHEHLLENCNTSPVKALSEALAEVWIQGEQSKVRDIIRNALTPELKANLSNCTRARLPNDLMKEAFDAYMRGY